MNRGVELKIPPPVVALFSAGVMWLISRSFAFDPVAVVKGPLALMVSAVGVVVEFSAVYLFLRAGTTVNPMKPQDSVRLVEEGIYRYTRNPMYLGALLLLSAWAIWLGNPVNVAVVGFFVWYVTRFQILPEERILRARFGERYDAYRTRVRRWF